MSVPQPAAVQPLRVAVITASTRVGRFAPTVTDWYTAIARTRPDMDLDLIDLAATELPAVIDFTAADPRVVAFNERIQNADAFVVVTGEYNRSIPAALKHALDLVPTAWRAKPVAVVSYGGISGGLRAAEHLRQIFGELHAHTVRNSVSLHNALTCFDDTGRPHDTASDTAAEEQLDQLAWWGTALRNARTTHPYQG
ncbi:NADPH-dependent oxidoreductase [Streptomyces luteoverticillatus]|uniref:NADPH-dependent oxidoreductase n=1 Tax=Streptomyces luteoverticillatus TaxID=66425 RepID=A0A3Q9FZK6_STRLT|nr:NAD(P)H-dependent oxidoreductase [Streptomyces luteoverticillatus]AZQ74367.1 NADPH-dependent oxidoreductase [Streptomyces luteoverticillatus]